MRLRLGLVLAACLSLVLAVPVFGHTWADIAPDSQTRNSGETAFWTASWNGSGSTRVVFCYGDGTACPDITTSNNSRGFSHKFYTCVYNTYSQTAYVTQGGHTYAASASTNVRAGVIC
jgi:hypothetical protein